MFRLPRKLMMIAAAAATLGGTGRRSRASGDFDVGRRGGQFGATLLSAGSFRFAPWVPDRPRVSRGLHLDAHQHRAAFLLAVRISGTRPARLEPPHGAITHAL